MRHRRAVLAAAFSAALLLPVAALAADAVPPAVAAAVADRGRPFWEIATDGARHPAAVLAYSGITSGMKVADLVPGEGYYTRMLAKLVGPSGHVWGMVPGGIAARGQRLGLIAKREGKPPAKIYGPDDVSGCIMGCYPVGPKPAMLGVDFILAIENVAEYRNVTAMWESWDSFVPDFAVPEQLDAVFSADGYHDLRMPGASNNMPALIRSIYASMKPGAVYQISDFAAAPGRGFDDTVALQRTEAAAVKAETLAAGFVLDGESTALDNPSDPRTGPAKWDSARYLLRFKKPASASSDTKRPKDEDAIMHNWYGNTMVFNVDATGNVSGKRIRYTFYNQDHTYQEMGPLGSGPGPFQAGTWFWSADGHNCMLHQYPLDERGLIVCHTDVVPRPVGVVINDHTDAAGDVKIEVMRGRVRPHVAAGQNQGYAP